MVKKKLREHYAYVPLTLKLKNEEKLE